MYLINILISPPLNVRIRKIETPKDKINKGWISSQAILGKATYFSDLVEASGFMAMPEGWAGRRFHFQEQTQRHTLGTSSALQEGEGKALSCSRKDP